MWVCDHCGQPMGDQDKKCSMCGTEKTVEKGKKTETAQVSQSFDFSKERTAPQASVEPQTPKVEERFTDQPGEDAQERPLIQIARRLVVMPKFWVIFASVILAFILVPWTIQKINQVSSTPRNEQSGDQINPELRKKFEKVIDDSLPDKQEWGREMLRRRVPTRFPEELVLDINKQDAEVRYEDKKKADSVLSIIGLLSLCRCS